MGRPKGNKGNKGKPNAYYIYDGVTYIQLTQNQEALIDIDLLEEVLKYRWCATYDPKKKGYYCVRSDYSSGKHKLIYIHRFIWELKNGPIPKGMQIDHINHNPLDNRLENLRVVSHAENGRNRKKNANNTSDYTGVTWHNPNSKWMAQIRFKGKYRNLGYFNCIIKAALTYDRSAREFGFHPNHYNFSNEQYQELLIKHPI